MLKKYRIPIILLALVVVVAIVAIVARKTVKKPVATGSKTTVTAGQNPSQTEARIQSVPSSELPSGLPDNLPIEKGAAIIQNFTAKDPATGKLQSTRGYTSTQSMDADFAAYQKYFKDNGWTITSTLDQPAVKSIYATKSAATMSVSLASDAAGKAVVVVSLVQ
jgi:hypothetical protein